MSLQNKNHLKDLCTPHYLETGKGLACYQGKNFRWEGGGEKRKEEEAWKGEGRRWREVREDGRGEKEGVGRRKEWEEGSGEKEVRQGER